MRTFPFPRAEMASKKCINIMLLSGTLGYCTFTHITEPNVLQGASTLAVHTFKLLYTDDDVAKSRSILKDEDSAVRSTEEKSQYD